MEEYQRYRPFPDWINLPFLLKVPKMITLCLLYDCLQASNKLECLSLPTLVVYLMAKLEPTRVEPLKRLRSKVKFC